MSDDIQIAQYVFGEKTVSRSWQPCEGFVNVHPEAGVELIHCEDAVIGFNWLPVSKRMCRGCIARLALMSEREWRDVNQRRLDSANLF